MLGAIHIFEYNRGLHVSIIYCNFNIQITRIALYIESAFEFAPNLTDHSRRAITRNPVIATRIQNFVYKLRQIEVYKYCSGWEVALLDRSKSSPPTIATRYTLDFDFQSCRYTNRMRCFPQKSHDNISDTCNSGSYI